MKTLYIILLLLVGVLFGGAVGFFGRPALDKSGLSKTLSLGSKSDGKDPSGRESRVAVTSLGRLEPETEIIQVGILAGGRIDHLGEKVKEGAFVAKDDPLAYLDSYAELLAARDLTRTQMEEAKERLKAETAFGKAAIAVAKLKIRQAEEVLPKQIEAQDAEVRRSRAELDKCNLDLQRSQKMLTDKAIPQSQNDSVALLARQCEEKWEANKATLEHLKIDRDLKLLTAHAELKSAEAGLVRAELTTLVASLTSALQVAQARLDRAVIRAPMDGEIIKVLTRPGETAGRNPLLKMGDTRSMYAIAEVYETDVRLVQPGQKATITSKAFPDEKITGVVERVGSLVYKNDLLALDPAKDADTRIVEVRIRLDDSRIAAKFNQLQVDVSISLDKP
jgi:HlyD family secretion protein